MHALAIALHILSVIVWVGGMFFAYLALRPALGPVEPPVRLAVWRDTFARFFPFVWASVGVILITGYWMIFNLGGMANMGTHIHIMQGLGIIMMLIFAHVFFGPYRRLGQFVAAGDFPAAATKLNQIRILIAVNLCLGLLVAVVGSAGRFWH